VVEQTPSRVVGEFWASKLEPSLLKQWPADFRLTVAYELVGTTLRSSVKVENPDDKPLPHGFGSHPYFRLPLGNGGSADDCILMVPAASYWELSDMLPTGKKLPAVGPRSLLHGKPLGETKLDDIFTDLILEAGFSRAKIIDPHNGHILTVTADDHFTECVVFNPPHRQAICIEPYSCAPDQFAMAEAGVIAAVQTLPPGGTWSGEYEIGLDSVAAGTPLTSTG
jgi:aldose 1-epimerase